MVFIGSDQLEQLDWMMTTFNGTRRFRVKTILFTTISHLTLTQYDL